MRPACAPLVPLVLWGCAQSGGPEAQSPEGRSPMFDSAAYTAVSARLRDAFVSHDTAYCDSVLPFFDDTALARMHPRRVTDGFVSNLIGHEAPQPAVKERFDALAAYSGAPIMRNWSAYVEARALQNAGERERAVAVFELLLHRFEEAGDSVGIASVSKRTGNLYLELDDPAVATPHLLRARALESRADIRSTITATLGRCYALRAKADSVRWCAQLLEEEANDTLQQRRGDRRALVNARWLRHLADLLHHERDIAMGAIRVSDLMDTLVQTNDDKGFLVAAEPAARIETAVLRARTLLRFGRARAAVKALEGSDEVLAQCPECLPQRLSLAWARADALADAGDLKGALTAQQERGRSLALNEMGRQRLAVEQARAKAEHDRLAAETDHLLADERSKALAMDREHRMQRIALVVMIGFIVLFAGVLFVQARIRRRMQLEQLRTRLSRDLHDDIGSTLSSINILTTVARRKADAGDEAGAAASLSGISERTQRLMRNMSDIVWSVDPDKDNLGELLVRMREFAAAVLEPKGIVYGFETDGDMTATVPPAVKSNLYLIFKEAVNNAAKHAEANTVRIVFHHEDHRLRMSISDNGKGLPLNGSPNGGNGLRNIRARAAEMRADLQVSSAPEQGTAIELIVPL